MTNLLILGGGDSPEREVSLRSAKHVAEAARQAGFNVQEADPANGLSVLDKLSKETIVFPILHGQGGEDGVLQAELEKRNIPFLGAGSRSSAECFDKWQTRLKLQVAGIPVPAGALVTESSYSNHQLSSKPHVLKVLRGGSSIGTLIVREPETLDSEEVKKLFRLDSQAVIEELVEGVEITVPILDQSALPIIEIRPPEGKEFDYENKYNGQSSELCPPPSLNEQQIEKANHISEAVHKAMDCRHFSRVDLIMRPDSSFVVLEINTIPGMTDQSLFPKSAAVAGLSMPALIKKFVELIKRDYSI